MSAKNNQIRNKMIQSHPKTDRQKLAGLESFLLKEIPNCDVHIEPYMMFTKGEDKFVGWNEHLTESQVKQYKIHPPDILLFIEGKMIVLELDGSIHDIKVEATVERDSRYVINQISYVVVNERDLRYKLGIAQSALLPQDSINDAFMEQIKPLYAT